MSGGSFGYLSVQELADGEHLANIDAMAKLLHDHGHHDAAARTEQVAAHLREARRLAAELEFVWHAAEWAQSGDSGFDRVSEAVTKWRELGTVSPEEADIAKRLVEIEREVAALRLARGAR